MEFQNSDIVFDGENIVLCDDVALICDKVFSENKRAKNDKEFHAILERELGKKGADNLLAKAHYQRR